MKSSNKKTPIEQMFVQKASLTTFVLIVTLFVTTQYQQQFVACESDSAESSSRGGGVDSIGDYGAATSNLAIPKRQYLIAPRIGRSSAPTTIWSSLEEATLTAPGQIQPNRGFPGPLRSSLLFLVGNRRIIGPRSGGLLPQARIGRRAAPIGLMPQPRVGRRSASSFDLDQENLLDGQSSSSLMDFANNGQQEVAVATLSDSSPISDALEQIISVAFCSCEQSSAETTIDKPVHRTSPFVPRLGKRGEPLESMDRISLEKLLCVNYGVDCERLIADVASQRDLTPLLALLIGQIANSKTSPGSGISDNNNNNYYDQQKLSTLRFDGGQTDSNNGNNNNLEILDLMAQQLKRETRAEILNIPAAKRLAFTPRIGRR